MIDERTEELASQYVLGLLSPEEARAFEAQMKDPEVARLVAQLETGAAAFAHEVAPRVPPPEVKTRIMREIEGTKRVVEFPKRGPAWFPWAASAACLALTAGWLAREQSHWKSFANELLSRNKELRGKLEHAESVETALQGRFDTERQNQASLEDHFAELRHQAIVSRKELGDLQAALSATKNEVATLKNRDALSQIKIATLTSLLQGMPKATAVIAWDKSAQRGLIKTVNLPETRTDQSYQLWIVDPAYKQPVSGGVFAPGHEAEFKPTQPISKADKFAVSLEKKGGVPVRQGPIVLLGE